MRDNLFRGKLTEKFAEAPKMRFDLLERGIVKDGFVYGSLVVNDKRCFICISAFAGNQSYVNNAYATMFEVDPETVGQYAGLTDKNGIEIFEGDIVKILDFQTGIIINECATFGVGINPYIDWDYLDSEIHTITGCDNNPHFCRNDNFCSLWELMCNYNQEENDCSVVEVIGNIHDNPELLGEPMKPASKDIAQSGLAPATENFELLEG